MCKCACLQNETSVDGDVQTWLDDKSVDIDVCALGSGWSWGRQTNKWRIEIAVGRERRERQSRIEMLIRRGGLGVVFLNVTTCESALLAGCAAAVEM